MFKFLPIGRLKWIKFKEFDSDKYNSNSKKRIEAEYNGDNDRKALHKLIKKVTFVKQRKI